MKNRNIISFLLLALFTLLMAACGATAADPTPTSIPPTAEEAEAPPEQPAPVNGAPITLGEGEDVTQTFVVVPDQSQASYVVDEEFFADALEKLGIQPGPTVVVGTTPGVTGELQLNFANPDLVEAGQFTVDLTGLRTDQEDRDDWLGENALEWQVFPEATFTATAVSGLPDTYTEGEEINFQLSGDLTIRDVTQPVTFDVTATLAGDTLQGTATLPLQMTDFGITPPDFLNTLTVANDFRIEVEMIAQRS